MVCGSLVEVLNVGVQVEFVLEQFGAHPQVAPQKVHAFVGFRALFTHVR